jgi:hypothetical protein
MPGSNASSCVMRAKSGKILARWRKEGVLKTAEIKTEQRKRQQVIGTNLHSGPMMRRIKQFRRYGSDGGEGTLSWLVASSRLIADSSS